MLFESVEDLENFDKVSKNIKETLTQKAGEAIENKKDEICENMFQDDDEEMNEENDDSEEESEE